MSEKKQKQNTEATKVEVGGHKAQIGRYESRNQSSQV